MPPRPPLNVPLLAVASALGNEPQLGLYHAGTGEPLVLLHGLGSSALDWELTIAHFASKYRTIAIDFRGSGESLDLKRPSGPFTIP